MSSFEKLFVNSTNRISAVKNIILTQPSENLASSQSSKNPLANSKNSNSPNFKYIERQQITETYEELQQKFQQLSRTVKEARQEKQMMSSLIDKIFKIQQGEDQKLSKRFRRKKSQIQAKYQCRIINCNKIYSSSTSLARHAKLKHSYCMSQPPQHNYLIPPSPNLVQSSQISKRDDTEFDQKYHEQEKEEPDGNNSDSDQSQMSFSDNCEDSDSRPQQIEDA